MNGVLGAQSLSAGIAQNIYVNNYSDVAMVTVNISNRNYISAKFSIAISTLGHAGVANNEWIEFNTEILGKAVFVKTGVAVSPGQYLVVKSSESNVSAQCWGLEMGSVLSSITISANTSGDGPVFTGPSAYTVIAGDTSSFSFPSISSNSFATSVVSYNFISTFPGMGIKTPASAALDFTTGQDFTVEFFARPSNTQTTYSTIMDTSVNNTAMSIGVGINNGGTAGKMSFFSYNNSTLNSTTTVTDNVWRHFAFTKQGTTVRLFVAGTQEASATWSVNTYLTLSDGAIGRSYFLGAANTDNVFNGYLSQLRILKGTALYTSNFTPPTLTLNRITNTSLLTLQNSTIIDNSVNGLGLGALNVSPTLETVIVPSIGVSP